MIIIYKVREIKRTRNTHCIFCTDSSDIAQYIQFLIIILNYTKQQSNTMKYNTQVLFGYVVTHNPMSIV